MPINYATNYEHEFIDWDKKFKFLNQFPLFHSKRTQQKFLSCWKKQIILSETRSYQNFSKINLNEEHFPLKILFGTTWLGWSALYIDKIEEIIYKSQSAPVKIPISDFQNEADHLKGKTFFEPTNQILYHSKRYGKFSYIPILIFSPKFPYPFSRVIDGNNRVQTAIAENHTEIAAYLITENFFFNHPEVFVDEFSRLIFLLCCDLTYFYNHEYPSEYFLPSKFNKKIQEDSILFHFLNISWWE